VVLSNFDLPIGVAFGGSLYKYGIYSQNSSEYQITENTFFQVPSSSHLIGTNTGILMVNSGIANNLIHTNNFQYLSNGIKTLQNNGQLTGLLFRCNHFNSNSYDIKIEDGSTIKSSQGGISNGCENEFVGTKTSSIFSVSQQISYYHSSNPSLIPYNPSSNISVHSNAHGLRCMPPMCFVPPRQNEQLLQEYQQLNEKNEDGVNDLEMLELSNAQIRHLMTDSLPHLEELKQWYSIINTPIAKYSLAETNFELKNYAEAENVLAEIPAMFEFGDKEQIEHNNYLDFHNFKKNLIDSERSYYDLTDAEIDNLKNIATATNGRSATMAKGVLCFFYGICLEDEEENFEEGGEIFYAPSQQNSSPEEEIAEENNIVYPNPTNNFIYFDNFAKKSVSLHNSNGILLETTKGSSMDLSKYPSGTYFLKINERMVKVVKN
jgi:hypothetical protein